ncbi:hypothetical protein PROFUN_01285 [Planoprotostelium fungivorum]|uniref:Uncharacterized protein n=1 Tax=Planoprotostelium fungivorum TaxID=1890364 RepID=A0A2P6NZP8_9EUKA|nr:hypothetical protein PROFUN_01285 [Planoprotostelium fungivorum]
MDRVVVKMNKAAIQRDRMIQLFPSCKEVFWTKFECERKVILGVSLDDSPECLTNDKKTQQCICRVICPREMANLEACAKESIDNPPLYCGEQLRELKRCETEDMIERRLMLKRVAKEKERLVVMNCTSYSIASILKCLQRSNLDGHSMRSQRTKRKDPIMIVDSNFSFAKPFTRR